MIRKILVPVRGDGKGDNVLAHAAALAHRHGAHIEIVHCRPRPEDLMPYGVAIPEFLRKQLIKQSYEVADQEEAGLRAELEALARSLDLDFGDSNPGARPTVTFVEEAGRQVDVIKRHGRLSDIIAVARPDRDRNLGKNTLKAALFQSGRPVLMCPPARTPPKVLGARVALAWNGSAEAARALAQGRNALMINWSQTVDPKTGDFRNDYGACVVVTVDQFYNDRARERFTRIKDFSSNRAGELEKMSANGGISPQVAAVVEVLYQSAALNSKIHTLGFMQAAQAAIDSDTMEAMTDLAARLSGGNSMIETAMKLGHMPKLSDILRVTEIPPSMDRLIGLPDPSNGGDED